MRPRQPEYDRAYRQRQKERKAGDQARLRDLEGLLKAKEVELEIADRLRKEAADELDQIKARMSVSNFLWTQQATDADFNLVKALEEELARAKQRIAELESVALSQEEVTFVLNRIHPDKNRNSLMSNEVTVKLRQGVQK
jgi:hypothetical protein